MPQIAFIKHLPNAKTPTQGSEHAAGFDLYAASIVCDGKTNQLIVDTGLSVAFDTGHVLLIYARSGLATKYGIRPANCVGVIDADYRGPLKVMLRSDTMTAAQMMEYIMTGDRVAQAILTPVPTVTWVEAKKLSDTVRGTGGFGSSGSR